MECEVLYLDSTLLTQNITFDDFIVDERTYDAVLLNLQIIGEAVKNIPAESRDRSSEIEWRKVAGLLDLIAHAYFQVDAEIIWDIVQNKIDPLLVSIQSLLDDECDNND